MLKNLDAPTLENLLIEADRIWHKEHAGQYSYSAHIKHTAKYLARHYGESAKKGRKKNAATKVRHHGGRQMPLLREHGNRRVGIH
jgi:hypothetical protein